MNSLLVIGGSGFFGKSILSAYKRGLLDAWKINKLLVISRKASQLELSHPNLLDNTVELINSDITKCNEIPYSDFVIHAASSSDASDYSENPEKEKENIITGVSNYIRLAKIFHRKSKIVYCSSGAIYGETSPNILHINEKLIGNTTYNINSNKAIYSDAKKKSEYLFKQMGKSGMYVSIARCFAFIGPYLPRNKHFAIGNFIEDILNNRPIKIKANHKVYRSYMYSDELVVWLMTIASSANFKCPTFNVGSDQSIELHELAKKISIKYNLPILNNNIIVDEYIDRYIPDTTKAKIELGLGENIFLEKAIELTLNYIRTQNN